MRKRTDMNRWTGLALLLAAGTQIAACHKAAEPPPENQVEAPAPPVAPPVEVAPPAPVEKPVAPPKPKAAPAPEVSADQQMIDDAEASGMTSRQSDGDGTAGGDNGAQ